MSTFPDDERLAAQLQEWQAPAPSPWLAGRIAARVAASRIAGWSLFPGPLRVRVAALTLAVVVGWSVGAFVSTPEASADDGVELAEIMW
jgi:hypothetical protein